MIPNTLISTELKIVEDIPTTKTYDLGYDKGNRYIDDKEALKQAIYKLLNTEKYQYPIYSFDYGVEFDNLVNKDIIYVKIELKRRIEECLLRDSRIESVSDFEFDLKDDTLTCEFNVTSIYGDINISKGVNV